MPPGIIDHLFRCQLATGSGPKPLEMLARGLLPFTVDNRIHVVPPCTVSADEVARAVEMLCDAGITAINLDLMYGLPKQSVADVVRTAKLAASLSPWRLAVFGYAHVPWFKTHQKLIDAADLPGAAERLAQAAAVRAALEEEGFVAIGLDHFAHPDDPLAIAARNGHMRRNFQGYTIDQADARQTVEPKMH